MVLTSTNTQLLVLGITCFVSMVGMGNIVPFLPIYARELGASSLLLGLIFSSFSASRALVAPYVGLLSDKMGRKRFLLVGLLGYAVLGFLLMWASSPWELVGNRVLQGIFAAMILPISMAMVADLTPPGKEGKMFGRFNTWFLLGFGVGPLLGGALYDTLGLAANFLVMGLMSLASMALVSWLLRDPPSSARQVREESWSEQVALLSDRGLLGIFLCRVGSAMGMGIYLTFLPVISAQRGLSNLELGMQLGFNVLVMTALQPLAGRWADKYSRLGLCAWGLVMASLAKGLMPFCQGFWDLLAMNLLEGGGSGLAMPAMTALIVEQGRRLKAGHGTVMGLFTLALSLGVFLGPMIGGEMADLSGAMGTDVSFYFGAVMSLLGIAALRLTRSRDQA